MKTKSEVQETKKAGRPPEGTVLPTETPKPEKAPGKRRGRPKTAETRNPAAGLSAGSAGTVEKANAKSLPPADVPPITTTEATGNAPAPTDTLPVSPTETAGNAGTAGSPASADTPPVTPADNTENAGTQGTALVTAPSRIEPLTREQLRTEYRKRTGIIKDQLKSIQQSFLVIAFQLYWIKENAMYPSAYKNIYEFADVEYGISRSTCGNLIYIVDTYAERDGDGRILENLEERYQDFNASQLIAMAGMPAEVRDKVRPDMSVRMINRMRKQEAQARLGSGSGADAAQKDVDAAQKDAAGTDRCATPAEQTEPAAPDSAAQDSREPQTSTVANADLPHMEKDAPAAGASPETGTGEPSGKAPETAQGHDTADSATDGTPADQGGDVQEDKGRPEPAERPTPQENMKVYNTLLSFTSYSRYEKEQEYLRTLIKNLFNDCKGAVTVKVIYEKATA